MRLFKRIVLTLFSLLIVFSISVVYRYLSWEKEVFLNLTNIECYRENPDTSEIINEKVEGFVLSDSKTGFVTFTVEEILEILSNNIKLNERFHLEKLCIVPGKGVWSIYSQYKNNNITFPWIRTDMVKDNRETAELYIREILIGNLKVPFGISKNLIVEINKGISDAIILVNENEFLGRVIRNIELLEDRVVIKGSVY